MKYELFCAGVLNSTYYRHILYFRSESIDRQSLNDAFSTSDKPLNFVLYDDALKNEKTHLHLLTIGLIMGI